MAPPRITPYWRSRYILYRYGHRIAYMTLAVGLFLALLANAALVSKVQETNRRQDAEGARVEAIVRQTEAGREVGRKLLCEVASFIEKRAADTEDLAQLRILANLRCHLREVTP